MLTFRNNKRSIYEIRSLLTKDQIENLSQFITHKQPPNHMSLFTRFSRLACSKAIRSPALRWPSNIASSRFASTATKSEKPSLKNLMKTYGSSALVVYFGLSAIDLPICFFAVHSLGEETIRVYINRAKQIFGYGRDEQELIKDVRAQIEEKEQRKLSGEEQHNTSLWERLKESTILTEFLIAYGIHKSLIILRLPVTAAITPATVKLLQKWGFNIGKFNKSFQTAGDVAKFKNKTGRPEDFVKGNPIPKQTQTKGRKWFNGLM
ncbi:Nat2p [Lachancea thermotolerans CBS 6340]|uniref:KLTH0H09284p n=1 Tax=Lachancea thermotolerans (strain ATCC 56472 / CBS 6340 / NRRL Y-8284) TaxID=559295 RepID=C5E305_LACTC|nr:KLTH0H09284p [Lachancea thermotolerans CBS 6340]CAR30416.1 KLTH0H09284p [Lachancea thermotolerans CBS 6340]